MNGERSPLRWAGMEMTILNVEVACGHSLRSQSIEESYFRPARYAQIRVFKRLLFLRWFWDDFDSLRVEHSDVVTVSVEHFYAQHKMFPFVRVRYEERLRSAILFPVVQIQLLHVVVWVSDSNEGTELGRLLTLPFSDHLLLAESPALAEEVNARRRTEESLLVAIRLLSYLQWAKDCCNKKPQRTCRFNQCLDQDNSIRTMRLRAVRELLLRSSCASHNFICLDGSSIIWFHCIIISFRLEFFHYFRFFFQQQKINSLWLIQIMK